MNKTKQIETSKIKKEKVDKEINQQIDDSSIIEKEVNDNQQNTTPTSVSQNSQKSVAPTAENTAEDLANDSLKAEQLTSSSSDTSINPLWLLAGIPVIGLGAALAGGGGGGSSSSNTNVVKDENKTDDKIEETPEETPESKPEEKPEVKPEVKPEPPKNEEPFNFNVKKPDTENYTEYATDANNNPNFEDGKNYKITLTGDLKDHKIESKNGDDFVVIDGVDNPANKFELNLGAGNNFIDANSEDINNFNITTTNGKDVINNAQTIKNSNVNLGDGDNIIVVIGSVENSNITTDKGNDGLRIQGETKGSNINLGAGNDTVEIAATDAKTKINLGDGDDKLIIAKNINSAGIFDGGDGYDILTLKGGSLDNKNINNFEEIILKTNSELTITSANGIQKIQGDHAASIKLNSGWAASETAENGFYSYQKNGETIKIAEILHDNVTII